MIIKNIQWVNNISNRLLDDVTDSTYRLLMMSVIDIMKTNKNIQVDEYNQALIYAENYWFFFEGNSQQLNEYLHEIVDIARKAKLNTSKIMDEKAYIINHIYRIILRKFDYNQIDEICDTLYWLIETAPVLGIKRSHIKTIFNQYFVELI